MAVVTPSVPRTVSLYSAMFLFDFLSFLNAQALLKCLLLEGVMSKNAPSIWKNKDVGGSFRNESSLLAASDASCYCGQIYSDIERDYFEGR
jgi:hypothetical protein